VTAQTTREERDRCLAAGFDAVVTKPASQTSLGAAIAEVTGAEPPQTRDASPLDSILEAVGGNVRLLARVRDAFATQTPRLLASLRAAIEAGDGEALYRSAHTLKGAIGNFDVPDAVEAARQLERAGQSSQFGSAAELLPRVEAAVRDLGERIDAALNYETA
jgi:two-component system sensor histidine kinase/response regulator